MILPGYFSSLLPKREANRTDSNVILSYPVLREQRLLLERSNERDNENSRKVLHMSHKAGAALQVNDLDSTLAFYTHYLDFALVSSQPDVGTALIRDSGGDLLFLADPRSEEGKNRLDGDCLVV